MLLGHPEGRPLHKVDLSFTVVDLPYTFDNEFSLFPKVKSHINQLKTYFFGNFCSEMVKSCPVDFKKKKFKLLKLLDFNLVIK